MDPDSDGDAWYGCNHLAGVETAACPDVLHREGHSVAARVGSAFPATGRPAKDVDAGEQVLGNPPLALATGSVAGIFAARGLAGMASRVAPDPWTHRML